MSRNQLALRQSALRKSAGIINIRVFSGQGLLAGSFEIGGWFTTFKKAANGVNAVYDKLLSGELP
jgi:hypothetical protein